MKTQKIEISFKTIVFTVLFLVFLKFLLIIQDLIFSLFIAFILMSALKPLVAFLEKRRIPRSLAVFIVYFSFLFIVTNLFLLVIPPFTGELTNFFRNLPAIIKTIDQQVYSQINPDFLSQYIPDLTNRFISVVNGTFSNLVFIVTTLFFGLYLLLEKSLVEKSLIKFIGNKPMEKLVNILNNAEKRMNSWFWGEIVLMSIIGVMVFIGLNLIGMKYTLALAVLAGLLEIVPNLGPIISLVPAILIGFSHSFLLGVSNIVLYFIIHQFENYAIVPLVMKKAVGFSPIITLAALIIGGKLAGILGVLLAVPTVLFLEAILIELR